MRYKVEAHPNREMRTIHVDEPLFSGNFGRHYKFREYEALSGPDRRLVDEILEVRGVREVYFSSYRVTVDKGHIFSWDEVLGPVLDVLSRAYGDAEAIEEVADVQ